MNVLFRDSCWHFALLFINLLIIYSNHCDTCQQQKAQKNKKSIIWYKTAANWDGKNNTNNCTGYWGFTRGRAARDAAAPGMQLDPGEVARGFGTRTIVLVNRRPGGCCDPESGRREGFLQGDAARSRTIVLKPRSRTKSPGSTRPPGVVFQGRRGQDDPDSAPMSSPIPIKPRSRCPDQQPDDPEPEQFYWYRPGKPDGRRPLPPHGVFHGNIWVIRYLPLYLVGHAQ